MAEKISYAAICREQAEVLRDSYKFAGVPFDPTDADYDDGSRAMFALADAFESLAHLCERAIEVNCGRGDDAHPTWSAALGLMEAIAAGFPSPSNSQSRGAA
jgi:hypothetical protein